MATILTKRSNTASSVPVAGDLTNSTGGAELAVNTADKRLFTKDSGGTVVELGTNPSSVTLPNGTANGVPYLNGSKVLTSGSALTFDGTNLGLGGSLNTSAGRVALTLNATTDTIISFGRGGTSVGFILQDTGGQTYYNGENTYQRWYVNAAEQMRLTSTGLGIGTSSPANKLDVVCSTNYGFKISDGTYTGVFTPSGLGGLATGTTSNHPYIFITNNSEKMTLDSSGNLLVGTTSTFTNTDGFTVYTAAGNFQTITSHVSGTASGAAFSAFRYNNNAIGSITQNGTTAVAYNTSSDYRLKNTIAPMTGALAKVAALKPCTYKWNADGSDGEGFIAHELAEVCPQAVTGEKDAVDAEGNPVYQGIDTSFLAGLYAAAIQELKAEVDSLKAEINTLKGI